MDSIKVFNNLSDENLHFESKEEFDRYYKKNKEIIDKMSTRALNMKITIDGYKLGRLKKELILFPSNGALGKRLGSINKQSSDQDQNQNLEAETEENLIEIKIDNMNESLKKIEIMLNQLFKILSN